MIRGALVILVFTLLCSAAVVTLGLAIAAGVWQTILTVVVLVGLLLLLRADYKRSSS